MLYNERVELILQQVQLQAIVKINDLKDLLNVSVDTVRRDLKTMEQSGLIKCIRGGAYNYIMSTRHILRYNQ